MVNCGAKITTVTVKASKSRLVEPLRTLAARVSEDTDDGEFIFIASYGDDPLFDPSGEASVV